MNWDVAPRWAKENNRMLQRSLPGLAVYRLSDGADAPEAPFGLFRDWQETQAQSSVKVT
jgi:hypothetical protein